MDNNGNIFSKPFPANETQSPENLQDSIFETAVKKMSIKYLMWIETRTISKTEWKVIITVLLFPSYNCVVLGHIFLIKHKWDIICSVNEVTIVFLITLVKCHNDFITIQSNLLKRPCHKRLSCLETAFCPCLWWSLNASLNV